MSQVAEEPNEYVQFWNDILADKFERFRHILMQGLSYHSDTPLRTLQVRPGSNILDVGCGWGDTALQLARMTGPEGRVLGLDCCDAFLAKGREDAAREGLNNTEFVAADVERYPFRPEYDLALSRFGMMFFQNPVIAMRNIRRALKPGGRLVFIVWRRLEDNPWLGVPKDIVLRHLPPPGEDALTCGPGPFSMASTDLVSAQLKAAGFDPQVTFTRNDGPVMVGRTTEEAMQFQLALGPAGEVFREAGPEAEEKREAIEADLREALATYQTSNGEVVMQSSSWTVTACNGTSPA